jgi:hypothetical protein
MRDRIVAPRPSTANRRPGLLETGGWSGRIAGAGGQRRRRTPRRKLLKLGREFDRLTDIRNAAIGRVSQTHDDAVRMTIPVPDSLRPKADDIKFGIQPLPLPGLSNVGNGYYGHFGMDDIRALDNPRGLYRWIQSQNDAMERSGFNAAERDFYIIDKQIGRIGDAISTMPALEQTENGLTCVVELISAAEENSRHAVDAAQKLSHQLRAALRIALQRPSASIWASPLTVGSRVFIRRHFPCTLNCIDQLHSAEQIWIDHDLPRVKGRPKCCTLGEINQEGSYDATSHCSARSASRPQFALRWSG